MTTKDEIESIIKEHGGVLSRTKTHQVYKFPDGRIYTMASSPSDAYRAEKNQLCDLRKMFGLNEGRGLPGERREPKHKPGNLAPPKITPSLSPMAEALRSSGVEAEALRAQIVQQEKVVANLDDSLRDLDRHYWAAKTTADVALRELAFRDACCWGCRFTAFLKRAKDALKSEVAA